MKNYIKLLIVLLIVGASYYSIGQTNSPIETQGSCYSGDIYHTGGNIGIGISNPSDLLHISTDYVAHQGIEINHTNASYDPRISFQISGTSKFTLGVDNSNADKFKIGTTSTDTDTRFTIINQGDVGINMIIPSYRLDIEEAETYDFMALFFNDANDQTAEGIIVRAGKDDESGTTIYVNALDGNGDQIGRVENNSGTFQLVDVSDIRTKTNIRNTKLDGIAQISKLKVVDYNRKANPNGELIPGFIAQEVQAVYPHPVSADYKTGLLGLAKDEFVPLLVKNLQEQQDLLERQDAIIEAANNELHANIEILNKLTELLNHIKQQL